MPDLKEELLQKNVAASRLYQAQVQPYLEPWGINAPAPVLGESFREYKDRAAILAKKLLPEDHKLRKIQYRRLDNDAFNIFANELFPAVKQRAFDNDTVPENAPLRQVIDHDPNNGQKIIRWIGTRSFVNDFKAPVRRVVSFATSNGKWDAIKAKWF